MEELTPQERYQAMVHAGQQKVNLVWEYTQSVIALFVICIYLTLLIYNAVVGKGEAPPSLTLTVGTVIGFYYGRSNHQKIGGVGPKPNEGQEYTGR